MEKIERGGYMPNNKSEDNRLTEKQKLFVDEYLIDLNATRAYKATYPNVKKDEAARVNASKLLTITNVKEYVAEKIKERTERTEVTQDMVIKELAKIGFAQITDFVEVDEQNNVIIRATGEIDKNKIGAIAGIKESQSGVEIKMNDKVKALELLGRHLAMFTDKQEVAATISLEKYLQDVDNGSLDY